MKKIILALALTFATHSLFAGELTCVATKILFPAGISVGDMITFNSERTLLGGEMPCEKAPDEIAKELGADLILGCGYGDDKEPYVFSKNMSEVVIPQIAVFACEE